MPISLLAAKYVAAPDPIDLPNINILSALKPTSFLMKSYTIKASSFIYLEFDSPL